MKKIILTIEGMACDGCAAACERALCAADGVKNASVSYKKGSAKVTFDPSKTTCDALKAVVAEAGYTAK